MAVIKWAAPIALTRIANFQRSVHLLALIVLDYPTRAKKLLKVERYLFGQVYANKIRNVNHPCSMLEETFCSYCMLLMDGDMEICPGPNGRHIPEIVSLLRRKGVKIFHENVKGLFTNSIYISEILQSFHNIDILTLSETHLRNHAPELMFEISDYSIVCHFRENGNGGCIAACICNKLV